MDFVDELRAFASQVTKKIPSIQTEEATKTALVLPVLSMMGYNVFDPHEVTPELNADVGVKKKEKVDYAILRDGKPAMLFECKWCGVDLDKIEATQLYRYFSVTDARIGVLTNGVVYRFFSDLETPNKMDTRPFLEFNLFDIRDPVVAELKKLTKSQYNLGSFLATAVELKQTQAIKRLMAQQFTAPSEDYVKFFAQRYLAG